MGSLSHTTLPSLFFRMNLYWKLVPAGRLTVVVQRGFEVVYELADRAIAEEVAHEPSWLMDPTR